MATSVSDTTASTPEIQFEHIDLPAHREYNDEQEATLDTSLVESIKAARAAGNNSLAELLEYELASHYFDTQL